MHVPCDAPRLSPDSLVTVRRPLARIIGGLLLASIGLGVRSLRGCDCSAPADAGTAYRDSQAVFLGEVKSVDDDGLAHVRVRALWKGRAQRTAIVASDQDGPCDARLDTGRTYLFYAKSGPRWLTATACERIVPVADSTDDVNYLESVKAAPR